MSKILSRSVLGLLVAAMLGVSAASPALAYGAENWQIGFAGTAVAPGTGFGFGFWGWCTFGGGVFSGNTGDCQFAQYVHTSSGSGFTCHESLDITSWDVTSGPPPNFPFPNFTITGTATITPTSLTTPCLALFPGSSFLTGVNGFAGAPTGIPAAAAHYNLNGVLGLTGEFQIQVTQIT
jgi:hypothetical protein